MEQSKQSHTNRSKVVLRDGNIPCGEVEIDLPTALYEDLSERAARGGTGLKPLLVESFYGRPKGGGRGGSE